MNPEGKHAARNLLRHRGEPGGCESLTALAQAGRP